ncbi:HEAT repeat-containing protein 3 [Rhipicephalus sanguineus]|uniref:HEAT repeat-containing protein 3 n=1 Tax=Rhipicephalus sanguineus TaxID=34632 RepID=UPI001893DFE4|nr:HEAT repeat-containing protein 3 [Rhipicephalus sanguineus]
MGKAKTKKLTSRRINPTGIPSARDMIEEAVLQEANVNSSVDELCDMLQGSKLEERECAANIMAGIAKDPASCESLLKAPVIRTAAPLLLDKNVAVRHSIAGALRNISAISHEACHALIDFDVMTPLVGLLKQYNSPWKPAEQQEKIDSKTEVFYESVHLLWNLCESSETSVSVFNRERLWTVLLPCMNVGKYGTRIATAVGHCLHAASEDNAELAECLNDFGAGIFENSSQDPGVILLQVLSAGILINIREVQNVPLVPAVLPLIPILTKALSLPILDQIKTLSEKVAELQAATKQKNVDTEDVEEKEKTIDGIVALILDALMAKQTALEILSNLCCGEGDQESEYVDISDDSSDTFDGDMETEETSAIFPLNISPEFHEALMAQNIVYKVLDHVSQMDDAFGSCLGEHKLSATVPRRVHAVRCRALLCIGNMVQALAPEDLGGIPGLVSMWTCLAQLAFVQMDTKDLELLEASTSACRSVLQTLASSFASTGNGGTPPLPSVSDEELRVLTQVGLQCSEPSVRTNVTRIMATLGCLLGAHETNVLKKVGQHLLEVSFKDPDTVVVTEALDAIFDVFGEDSTDTVAREIELVAKLRQVLPAFKSKVKQAKSTLPSHYPVIVTAKTNFIRFLKYKTQRRGMQNGSGGDIG